MKMEEIERYTIERTVIERRVIVCPREVASAILQSLVDTTGTAQDVGWRSIFSGPYTNRDMFPKCDMTRSKLILERELER